MLAVVVRIGPGGFVLYIAYSLLTVLLLGGAWASAAPPLGIRQHFLLFGWARLVREGASDILPLSQVGGLVIGTRLLIARGIAAPLVNASVLVDLTTEMAGQIVFTLFGIIGFVLLRAGHSDAAALLTPIVAGTALMVALMIAFFAAQRWAMGVAQLLLARLLPTVSGGIGEVSAELARIYGDRAAGDPGLRAQSRRLDRRRRGGVVGVAADGRSPAVHQRHGDGEPDLRAQERRVRDSGRDRRAGGGLCAARTIARPAGAGGTRVSLAKRARDLAVGAPALAAWQVGEARAIGRAQGFRVQRVGLEPSEAHIVPSGDRASTGTERI